MTITSDLAALLARPIASVDRARAAVLLLDWTGCAVAGQKESAGQMVTATFADEAGSCHRIGSDGASVLMAALHNGCLGNVLEMDDVDKRAVLHAAPTVIPAAFAMAQFVGASKDQMLNAIVIGYEATIRIGRAVGTGHYAFWHNTATCGPFGAAAAASYLLGLRGDDVDMVSAFGLAGTQAAGLWQTRHEAASMAKQLHAGHAAHAGVLSALLAAQGFQGPRSILEGEQGFFKAMCPGADPQQVLTDYGDSWLIHETSLKPYPACRHAHAAIDAALLAPRNTSVETGRILVETYSDALKFCDKPDPRTAIEAKFSLQHSVAVAITKGELQLADFDPDNVSSTVARLRDRITVQATAEFTDAYPNHYGAAVTIGGNRYVAKDAYGDPEHPMSEDDIRAKAMLLMRYAGMTTNHANTLSAAALTGSLNDYVAQLM